MLDRKSLRLLSGSYKLDFNRHKKPSINKSSQLQQEQQKCSLKLLLTEKTLHCAPNELCPNFCPNPLSTERIPPLILILAVTIEPMLKNAHVHLLLPTALTVHLPIDVTIIRHQDSATVVLKSPPARTHCHLQIGSCDHLFVRRCGRETGMGSDILL